jgi:hypothetical protein
LTQLTPKGTYFTPETGIDSESQIEKDLANWTKIDAKQLLLRYPALDPTFSSPYGSGTENGTGLASPEFKRESSILGDIIMLAPCRQFVSRAISKGTSVYSYLFSDRGTVDWLGTGGESLRNVPPQIPQRDELDTE